MGVAEWPSDQGQHAFKGNNVRSQGTIYVLARWAAYPRVDFLRFQEYLTLIIVDTLGSTNTCYRSTYLFDRPVCSCNLGYSYKLENDAAIRSRNWIMFL